MNPTRTRAQSFAAGVVQAVPGDDQNGERTEKDRAVGAIAPGTPCESHMAAQEHAYQHENRHRGGAMNFHRPGFGARLKIAS